MNMDCWANRFSHEGKEIQVFGIDWDDERYGFGRFEILIDENGKPHLETECMCSNEDKKFAYELMKKLIDIAEVEG